VSDLCLGISWIFLKHLKVVIPPLKINIFTVLNVKKNCTVGSVIFSIWYAEQRDILKGNCKTKIKGYANLNHKCNRYFRRIANFVQLTVECTQGRVWIQPPYFRFTSPGIHQYIHTGIFIPGDISLQVTQMWYRYYPAMKSLWFFIRPKISAIDQFVKYFYNN